MNRELVMKLRMQPEQQKTPHAAIIGVTLNIMSRINTMVIYHHAF